jgi:hypothetical protein
MLRGRELTDEAVSSGTRGIVLEDTRKIQILPVCN